MKVSKKTNKHIIIMSVIGILMSSTGLLLIGNMAAFLLLGVLPMFFIIAFLVKKYPAFGICFTGLFFINRISILVAGTLLARGVIILMIAYFIYVDWLCIRDRKNMESENRQEAVSAEL